MTTSINVERRRLRARRALLTLTTVLCSGLAAPALAQVAATPPARPAIDGNGVDLRLGTINVDGPVLSAGGSGAQGLAWRKFEHNGGWGDNLVATLSVSGSDVYVSFGTTTDHFTKSGTPYISTEGDGATLSLSGNTFTWTGSDGTVAHFTKVKVGAYPYDSIAAIVTDVTRPGGEALTYTYASTSYCSKSKPGLDGDICTTHSTMYRIASVANNSKYQLSFAYDNWDGIAFDPDTVPDSATMHDWGDITGVAMTNTAVTGASVRTQSFAPSSSGGNNYYTITDAMNRSTVYRYGTTMGITRPGSSSEDVTVGYDSAGRVANVTSAAGTTTYGYADNATLNTRTTTVTDPLAHATSYVFDLTSNRLKQLTNAVGKSTTMTYDTAGRLTRVTLPEGNFTNTTYDARGNVAETRAVAKAGSGLSDIVTSASYDATCGNAATCNQPNATVDARGNVTDYSYDAGTGELLSVTLPAATTGAVRPKTTYTYTTVNGVSLPASSTTCRTGATCAGTADEIVTSMAYDANGLATTMTRKAGDNSLSATVATAYDDVGNAVSVDGPLSGNGDVTTWRYDADREVVGAISADPDGSGPLVRQAVRTTYDAKGRATLVEAGTVTDASDSAWSAFSSQQSVATTYDGVDRPLVRTLAAGGTTYGVTQLSYDHQRLDCVATRMNAGAWGSLPASGCGAQAAGGYGPDRIVKYGYDAADRQTLVTSAYGTTTPSNDASASYTDDGQVANVTDAEGNKTGYAYDGFDRLARTSYPSTTKGSGTVNTGDYEQLAHDAAGNVTSRVTRKGDTIGYVYDNLGRLSVKDLPGGSASDVYYAYDLTGRLLSARFASSAGAGIVDTWDALGRLVTTTNTLPATALTLSYQYDLTGRRTRITHPDGVLFGYSYDVVGRLRNASWTAPSTGTVPFLDIAYDSMGRRMSVSRASSYTGYGWDAVSRLSGQSQSFAGGTGNGSATFAYNPASQIASRTQSNDAFAWTGAATGSKSYTANGLNQLGDVAPASSMPSSIKLQPGQFSQVEECDADIWIGERDVRRVDVLTEHLLAQRDGFAMLLLHAELVDEDDDGDEDATFRPLR